MKDPRRATLLALLALTVSCACAWAAQREDGNRRPSLSLRATPGVGISPLRVRAVVDVRDGADDYADFYCPTVEWDWGDGTISENSSDCDPYEAGTSTIQRRWSANHLFNQAGRFRVSFRLRQKTKVIASVNATVVVRPGMGSSEYE